MESLNVMKVIRSKWRDELTGREVSSPEDMMYYDSVYWWAEGNMGCDCNRGSYFSEDVECSRSSNRFVLLSLELSDGTVIDDFSMLNPHNACGIEEREWMLPAMQEMEARKTTKSVWPETNTFLGFPVVFTSDL